MKPEHEGTQPTDLEKLRQWVTPVIGFEVPDQYLLRLQEIIESAAKEAGMVPQYRRMHDA